ncbi:MAG: magnesium/cobalt transporter CorA [Breznakibacter sp.]
MKRSKKAGLPPGSLVYLGKVRKDEAEAHFMCFNPETLIEQAHIKKVKPIFDGIKSEYVNWLSVNGIHNTDLIQELGESFNLESLILEDILNTDHRPKFEETENAVFFTLKLIAFDKKLASIDSEQVSFVLGSNYVISFQENHSEIFTPIIDRIRQNKGRIRRKGNDYLMYAFVDILVDNYFEVVEDIEQNLDDIEDSLGSINDKQTLFSLQLNKRALQSLRRYITPLRDQVSSLIRSETEYISEHNIKYFRDLQDHLFHIVESIDNLLEINESIKEMHMSNLSLRMNQIMQTLTLFTAIFTPLTFLAGVYGMNFENIPELKWHNGYLILWGIWVVIATWLLYVFKRRKWL